MTRDAKEVKLGYLTIGLRTRALPKMPLDGRAEVNGRVSGLPPTLPDPTILPIGGSPPSRKELAYAARYVACRFTPMDPPTYEAACVVFDLLLRMAKGDMEAVAEFELLATGLSPLEELDG